MMVLSVDGGYLSLLACLPRWRSEQVHDVVWFGLGQDVRGALTGQLLDNVMDAIVQTQQITEGCFGLTALFEFCEWVCLRPT